VSRTCRVRVRAGSAASTFSGSKPENAGDRLIRSGIAALAPARVLSSPERGRSTACVISRPARPRCARAVASTRGLGRRRVAGPADAALAASRRTPESRRTGPPRSTPGCHPRREWRS
jgi:hypothetical protein